MSFVKRLGSLHHESWYKIYKNNLDGLDSLKDSRDKKNTNLKINYFNLRRQITNVEGIVKEF